MKCGIALSRDFHYLGAKVHAFPFARRDGSQVIARAATNRQYSFTRLDQEPKKSAQEFVVISVALYPTFAARGDSSQVLARAFASLFQRSRSPAFLVRLALAYYNFHLAAINVACNVKSSCAGSPRRFGPQFPSIPARFKAFAWPHASGRSHGLSAKDDADSG